MATIPMTTAEMHTEHKEKVCCPFPIHHRTVTSPLPSARPTRGNASQMTLSPASRNWLGVERSGDVSTVFTLASLPPDHPHAFQRVKRRLSDVGERIAEIATSPKLSEKVKMKLGRKSCRSLRPPEMHVDGANDTAPQHLLPETMRTDQFDQDAQSLNSSELERVLDYMNIDSTIAPPPGRPWLGSSEAHIPCSPCMRSEEMRTIGTSLPRSEDMREVTNAAK
ncbi:hypothetical protein DOTSEDRAFT_29574 [Dothistroma septosporum NZE10]|uniref:Uncharacterized protein n=1 Tax=Dothistroma septosporum (strain NZE10 / CBS 128990) TaxID=675120 RepID=N1PDL8_DOTSN|nr:hypothetical protein DOTSEDRAFT_29574 [Dothistroma septosporum NZE10]